MALEPMPKPSCFGIEVGFIVSIGGEGMSHSLANLDTTVHHGFDLVGIVGHKTNVCDAELA